MLNGILIAALLTLTCGEKMAPSTQPYGSWKSPITSSTLVESAIKLGDITIDGNTVYWNEIRPSEKGRSVVVKWDQSQGIDINQDPYNVRTRVHEYGGGSYTVHEGTLYFTNFKDQHFYSLSPDGTIKQLTTADNKRYANPVYDPEDNLIYAIEETHNSETDVINSLVAIDAEGKLEVQTLHSGHDFYSSIALNPDGTELAFLTWNHPRMPWDGTELWAAQILPGGKLTKIKKVTGGHSESIFQPRYAPDGKLFFISDQTGFWNLYERGPKEIIPCYPLDAEFGSPQWVFGMSRYDFVGDDNGYQIACIYTIKGTDHLALLDLNKYTLKKLPLSYTNYSDIHTSGNTLYFQAASPDEARAIYSLDLSNQDLSVIRKSKEMTIDTGYFSKPETLEFPTENGLTAFAFFYPPKNKDFTPLSDEKPPLIVKSHGGPSAHVSATLNLEIQYWTSRGFAFLDVNYGGSTGYGRAYRERLKGNWGIVDVDDCTNGALYLAKLGRVDPERLAIKGGSAGGFTTLAALTFRDVFKAGASYFGVSDLVAMTDDTHKFESRYLDGLIGSYPEQKERYIEYSPIHHTDKLSCPVILLQGAEDKIVPPSQSELMYKALKEKGIPVAYLVFEGEQHGFRNAENIKKALDSELYFYSQIFHFTPSDALEPIPIDNWKPSS